MDKLSSTIVYVLYGTYIGIIRMQPATVKDGLDVAVRYRTVLVPLESAIWLLLFCRRSHAGIFARQDAQSAPSYIQDRHETALE